MFEEDEESENDNGDSDSEEDLTEKSIEAKSKWGSLIDKLKVKNRDLYQYIKVYSLMPNMANCSRHGCKQPDFKLYKRGKKFSSSKISRHNRVYHPEENRDKLLQAAIRSLSNEPSSSFSSSSASSISSSSSSSSSSSYSSSSSSTIGGLGNFGFTIKPADVAPEF